MHELDDASGNLGRRELLKALSGAAGYAALRIAIPVAWSAPVVLSMPLPAHATMSCTAMTNSEGTFDAASTLTATQGADGKVVLVARPSNALNTAHTFYSIVERPSCTVERGDRTYGTTIISSTVPSTNTGPLTHSVSRPAGLYDYQLRWDGGFSAWVTLEVK